MIRRRVLLSACACSPLWGSEPGVGWQWLIQLVKQYDVVLLTHAYFREHIEPAIARLELDVEVHYLQAPAFGFHPHVQLNSRLYYIWWQFFARKQAKLLIAQTQFDLIHHLTWGTLRFPCWLGGLGVPLVMGPLGGGESAPLRLFKGLPLKLIAFDFVRSVSLMWVKFDPIATWGPRRSALVLCKSEESFRALPAVIRSKAVVLPEIGSPPVDLSQRVHHLPALVAKRRFRLLFAGRLLGWKGVALALGAVEKLVRAGHDVELDIAGEGPLRAYLAQQVIRFQLGDRVKLLGNIPRPDLLTLYAKADIFVFPSLHDSSGNVVLEALSRGVPVVCLDLGGPQLYVNSTCACVVSTKGLSRSQLEQNLADTIGQIIANPQRLEALSQAAAAHAKVQTWEAVVQRAYAAIDNRLKWSQA
jgi:glycosyltransferase involved in cell wall biosynthesis